MMAVVVLGSGLIHAIIPVVHSHSTKTSVLWISVLRVATGLVQGSLYPTWAGDCWHM